MLRQGSFLCRPQGSFLFRPKGSVSRARRGQSRAPFPNVDAMILASAFRIDGIAPEDAGEIMRFKDIVKSYLKMEVIEAR